MSKRENINIIRVNTDNVMILNKPQVQDIISKNIELFRLRTGLDASASIDIIYNKLNNIVKYKT